MDNYIKTVLNPIYVNFMDEIKNNEWVFNTDTMTFQSFEEQKKNRPEIKFNIYKAKDKSIWKMFAKHHYLSHSHNNAAHVYLATINDEIAGFLSVLHLPHPKVKNIKNSFFILTSTLLYF